MRPRETEPKSEMGTPYTAWQPGSFFARAGAVLALVVIAFAIAVFLVWRYVEAEKPLS